MIKEGISTDERQILELLARVKVHLCKTYRWEHRGRRGIGQQRAFLLPVDIYGGRR